MLKTAIKNSIAVVLVLFLLTGNAPHAFAAITATDNFDSYSNLASLNTLNGGSGWNGAWAVTRGTVLITNTQSLSSPNSASVTSVLNLEEQATRALTSNADGDQLTFSMRASGTANNQYFYLVSGSTFFAGTILNHTGSINLNGTSIGSWSTDTWYTFVVDLDYTNDRFRASINGGAFSSYVNFDSPVSSADKIALGVSQDSGSTNSYYWDSIGPAGGGAAAAPYMPFWMFFWGWWN